MAPASTPFVGFSLSGPTVVGPFAIPVGSKSFKIVFDLSLLAVAQVVWIAMDVSTDGGVTWQNVGVVDITVATPTADAMYTLGQGPDGSQRLSGAGWQMRCTLTPVGGLVALGVGTLSAT